MHLFDDLTIGAIPVGASFFLARRGKTIALLQRAVKDCLFDEFGGDYQSRGHMCHAPIRVHSADQDRPWLRSRARAKHNLFSCLGHA